MPDPPTNQPHPGQVFVAKVTNEAKANFSAPNLNAKEHSDYKWFKLPEVEKLGVEGKLHPVVKKLLSHHLEGVLKAAGAKAAASSG